MSLFEFFERGFLDFNRYVELLLQLSLDFFSNESFSPGFGFRKFSVRFSSLLILFPFLLVLTQLGYNPFHSSIKLLVLEFAFPNGDNAP